MTAQPVGPRSHGTPAEATSRTDGSPRISSSDRAALARGNFLLKAASLAGSGPKGHLRRAPVSEKPPLIPRMWSCSKNAAAKSTGAALGFLGAAADCGMGCGFDPAHPGAGA